MDNSTSKPKRYSRTRQDHVTETAEDYTEAVYELIESQGECRLKDLASYFGVTHVTANKIVARLVREGWLSTEPYRPIDLTAKGSKLAEKCRRRHVVVYQFLLSLGVDSETATIDSEGIEHHISPKTLNAMQEFVNQRKPKSSSRNS
jgi:DtxR family transcriptional regulator, manganese transport regulator